MRVEVVLDVTVVTLDVASVYAKMRVFLQC